MEFNQIYYLIFVISNLLHRKDIFHQVNIVKFYYSGDKMAQSLPREIKFENNVYKLMMFSFLFHCIRI